MEILPSPEALALRWCVKDCYNDQTSLLEGRESVNELWHSQVLCWLSYEQCTCRILDLLKDVTSFTGSSQAGVFIITTRIHDP